jgi:3-oxoacyl-[acyl-carrier-protein] synthase-3
VQQALGIETEAVDPAYDRFADLLDSMGMVEFLAVLAEDCGVQPEAIEQCVGRQFGTVAQLAASLLAAGLGPRAEPIPAPSTPAAPEIATAVADPASPHRATAWLATTAVRLPTTVQGATTINALVGRPAGWLEGHAGIHERRTWAGEDPLAAAAEAGGDALRQAGLAIEDVGALLVTSEASPLLAGLAAALHHRLGLRPGTVALEVGGACTGFLAALWLARLLLPQTGAVLVLAIEAPTRYLRLRPGPSGEAAALFGDAAAACLLCDEPPGAQAVPLVAVALGADGGAAQLLQIEPAADGTIELRMDGGPLAGRALQTMAHAVHDLAQDHALAVADFHAVVAHGGNGCLPALLARQIGLPPDRVWSETPRTGNLGSASLPVAWVARQPTPHRPVAWTAVGAGLTWAAALTGTLPSDPVSG